MTSPNRAATRNPIPKYMIGSIINDASNSPLPANHNDTRAQSPPVQPKISPNPGSALVCQCVAVFN